jgi:branched-chain amino acid transport system ATP-binding protein/branched-chain amino acid transport system permease protein
MADALLRLEEVSVSFGGVHAVRDVTLDLQAGAITGLVGPNGSGKTTLIGVVSRLVQQTHGRMTLRGEDCSRLSADQASRLGIARTFQNLRLVETLTVRENVMLGADMRRPSGGWRRSGGGWERSSLQAADEVLEVVGIAALADHLPASLSYGDQRRVEIARALAAKPALLLLDEPTAGMNARERAFVGALLRKLCGLGITQLVIEHDVKFVTDVCDHLFVMNAGVIIASGEPAVVFEDKDVQAAYTARRPRVLVEG